MNESPQADSGAPVSALAVIAETPGSVLANSMMSSSVTMLHPAGRPIALALRYGAELMEARDLDVLIGKYPRHSASGFGRSIDNASTARKLTLRKCTSIGTDNSRCVVDENSNRMAPNCLSMARRYRKVLSDSRPARGRVCWFAASRLSLLRGMSAGYELRASWSAGYAATESNGETDL